MCYEGNGISNIWEVILHTAAGDLSCQNLTAAAFASGHWLRLETAVAAACQRSSYQLLNRGGGAVHCGMPQS